MSNAEQLSLLHALRCALTGEMPHRLPQGVSWVQVYNLAKKNSVEGLAWFGACKSKDIPSDLREEWRSSADAVMMRRVRFDIERESVIAALCDKGLSCLPLKGILIADYYPRPEMRTMVDNDILYGFVESDPCGGFRVCGETLEERNAETKRASFVALDAMKSLGYENTCLGAGNADCFNKKPIFNFELHRMLMEPQAKYSLYYSNPWRRAIQDVENPLMFYYSNEDEYVFLIAHAAKHFYGSGFGVRLITDLWAFIQAKGSSLDWSYVNSELQDLGLLEFEETARAFAEAVFRDDGSCKSVAACEPSTDASTDMLARLTEDQLSFALFMLECGTHGSVQMRMRNSIERLARDDDSSAFVMRMRFLKSQIFPDAETRKNLFPIFDEHPVLMPLYPLFRVYRVTRGFLRSPKQVLSVLRDVKNPEK